MVGLLSLPTAALADPPDRGTSEGLSIVCDVEGGFIEVFVGTGEEGVFADLFADLEGEFFYGFTEDVVFDGTDLEATIPLEDDFGSSIAPAVLDATFEPAGEPETSSEAFRDGNRQVRFTDTTTELVASGTLVIDGIADIDLSECSAASTSTEYFFTNPATEIYRFDGFFVECGFSGDAGNGFLFAESFDEGTFLELFVFDDGVGGFTDSVVLTDTELQAEVALDDDRTAVVDATLTSTGTEDFKEQSPSYAVRGTEEFFDVAGTVTIDGLASDLMDCFAVSYDVFERYTDKARGAGGGRPPANDAPAEAELIEVPGEAVIETGAADVEPEAECSDEFGPLPIEKTVWYAFVGTGEEATLDTAGSTFDTIVGVYDEDLNLIACNDDVDSLQARLTVGTVVGETYLVQVGGFGGDTGTLVLTIE